MKDTEAKETYKKIINHTLSKNLKSAFDLLSELLREVHKPDWTDKKNELEQNYQYLLKYAIDGINDPEQEAIYNKMRLSLLQLTDQTYNAIMTSFSSEYPYVHKRNISKVSFPSNEEIEAILSKYDAKESLKDLLKDSNISTSIDEETKRDETLSLVFLRLWLKAFYSDRETALIENIIYGEVATDDDKCLVVAAITLGLLLQFDEKKFDLITTIATASTGIVQNRAFIGLVLSCNLHNARLSLYPNLQRKLNLLTSKSWFNEKFATCLLFFINGLETEKISEELKNSIMPDIMKESAKITDNLDLTKLGNASNLLNENPEWENLMEKWDVSDKIQRFANLQKNGADVYLTTFASMKNHAFFSHICNWFRPYNTNNSWVKREFKGNNYQFFDLISLNPTICDSDRYSMLFSLSSIPDSYLKNLEEGLKMQGEQIKLVQEENKLMDNKGIEKMEIQLYWQDLYRFFKLHPNHSAFPDPYLSGLDISNLPFFHGIDARALNTIADSYLKKKYYTEALNVFCLIDSQKKDSNTLQKIGFCYQKKGIYTEALSYYEKAELMASSKNVWLSKMQAFCLMQLGKFSEAISYYELVTNEEQNDMSSLLNQAQCHIGLKQYSSALPILFKIEYLSPNNKVYRSISRCALLTGKLDQAESYLQRIEDDKKTCQDWIGLGNLALCKKNSTLAIEYYTKAKGCIEEGLVIADYILNDVDLLVENGLKKEQIPFIIDRIRYID